MAKPRPFSAPTGNSSSAGAGNSATGDSPNESSLIRKFNSAHRESLGTSFAPDVSSASKEVSRSGGSFNG